MSWQKKKKKIHPGLLDQSEERILFGKDRNTAETDSFWAWGGELVFVKKDTCCWDGETIGEGGTVLLDVGKGKTSSWKMLGGVWRCRNGLLCLLGPYGVCREGNVIDWNRERAFSSAWYHRKDVVTTTVSWMRRRLQVHCFLLIELHLCSMWVNDITIRWLFISFHIHMHTHTHTLCVCAM